jgi:ABC-type uncharacterized transport system permease subunit
MTFLRSLAVLTAVCLCIAFAFFFGYGLATHNVMPIVYGAGLLLLGASALWFLGRRDRERRSEP